MYIIIAMLVLYGVLQAYSLCVVAGRADRKIEAMYWRRMHAWEVR